MASTRDQPEQPPSRRDATDVGARRPTEANTGQELRAGTEIGQYMIESVLGRGGMGIVYRATDRKLHRPVAIKFLSSTLADSAARHRFRKEAETTSALNHPHIVTVYDVGEHDGQPYIVSELIDGGTLDDWAATRRSWRQSVELLTGVADGLAAAHSAGVLHRDVKPGNILIGSKGYGKIGDFGLAKLASAAADAEQTRTTRAGVVVGTVAYMSPEQATGQALDARSDIFSFGIVLYELVTRKRPFAGANDLETLKAIAHGAPAPLSDDTPELLRLTLDKALEKEPGDRYQTMQDLVADLKRVARKSASSQVPVAPRGRPAAARWPIAVLGVALAAALVPATLYFLRPAPSPGPQIRLAFEAPNLVGSGLAVSPDGRQIAYTATVDGLRQILVRPIGGREARRLDDTGFAAGLFWSPDSRQIAFLGDGKLKRVDVTTGAVQTIAEGPSPLLPGSWTPDGTILYTAGLFAARVPAVGGAAIPLAATEVMGGRGVQLLPLPLPDDEHFLFMASQLTSQTDTLMVGSYTTGEVKSLLTVPRAAAPDRVPGLAYSNGFLLFIRDNSLVAQAFDEDTLSVRGDAVPIADGVAEFSVSPTVLVYRETAVASIETAPRRLVWRDRSGRLLGEIAVSGPYIQPSLSPDERRVAVSMTSATAPFLEDIYAIDVERGSTTRITFHEGRDSFAVWSADGTQLAFNSGRDRVLALPSALYARAANGAGAENLLFAAGADDQVVLPWDWSGSGRYLLFGRAAAAEFTTHTDIWALDTADHMAFPVLESPFRKGPARLSPDGRWIAYGSNESNGDQIFVQPFPNVGTGKWQVSAAPGGYDPRWRNDGRELFYLSPAGEIMSIEVSVGDAFEAGRAQTLFATGMQTVGGEVIPNSYYLATADGQRFLTNEPAAPSTQAPSSSAAGDASEIHVIVNWAVDLAPP